MGPGGCRVHSRRPLVCRLYPLGQIIDTSGGEAFAHYASEPGCEAEVEQDGTVAEYLESQGAEPYFKWAKRYGDVYCRMDALLHKMSANTPADEDSPAVTSTKADSPPPEAPISPWQDIDASLAEYCAAKGLPLPGTIEDAVELHIQAME